MTTLAANISASDTVIVVNPGSAPTAGFRFRIDDEILEYIGPDRGDTQRILAYLQGDRTRWRVARGQEGTTAASHTSGDTLYAVSDAWATGESLTPPGPFAAGAGGTPTLAEVLAEGADVPADGTINGTDGAQVIFGADGSIDTLGGLGAEVWVKADGSVKIFSAGGSIEVAADGSIVVAGTAAYITIAADGSITLTGVSGTSISLTAAAGINLSPGAGGLAVSLPTSNPGAGLLWQDNGAGRVVKVGS